MSYTIEREDPQRDLSALRNAVAFYLVKLGDCHPVSVVLQEIADSIEEQVKPLVEEPTEPWSVIFANVPCSHGIEPRQLVLTSVGWIDAAGNGWGDFSSFSDVEVLRVGIGQDQSAAYNEGGEDFAEGVRQDISALRSSTSLVVEQRAYDKALAAVAALLEES